MEHDGIGTFPFNELCHNRLSAFGVIGTPVTTLRPGRGRQCHNRLSAFGVIGTEQDNKNNGGMKMGHNRLSAFGVIGTVL